MLHGCKSMSVSPACVCRVSPPARPMTLAEVSRLRQRHLGRELPGFSPYRWGGDRGGRGVARIGTEKCSEVDSRGGGKVPAQTIPNSMQ